MHETTANGRRAAEALAVSLGMALLVWFVHQGMPWILVSAAGFLLTTATMASTLRNPAQSAELLGLRAFGRKALLFAAAGCAAGVAGGMWHRAALNLPIFPSGGLQAFALLACLIGAVEELIYRGWLQGGIRVFGWPAAVAAASLAHGMYKAALFAWPGGSQGIDLACLGVGLGAAAMGIVPGLLRELSGSVVPSILAHSVFDLMVYGAVARAPWWVWN